MISFITWVNRPDEYADLLQSIELATDGLGDRYRWEAVKVDKQGISMMEAYRIGQDMAKGRIRVYVHQDVEVSKELVLRLWDVLTHREEVGWCGVIGNTRSVANSWWHAPKAELRGVVRQLDKTGRHKPTVINFGHYEGYAAQLDGLLLATAKQWDFPIWPGHHFADLVLCQEALRRGLYNYIVDAPVTHKSWGEDTSNQYIDNRAKFVKYLQGK